MKKIALLTTALCTAFAASQAQAMDHSAHSTALSGFYVGAYGGYNWSDIDVGAANVEPDGADYGAFVGYKLDLLMDQVDGFGIGLNGAIEGFYGTSNSDDTLAGVSVEKDKEWGISFRPGLSILDGVTSGLGINPYGIIGYRHTEFEALGGDEDFDGFELGIGTELVAYGDLGVRLEYSHTWYGDETIGGVNIDPDSHDVRVGVAYHF